MQLLYPRVQAYPWGSRTLIAGMRGQTASVHPEAELWYGTHPGGLATTDTGTLQEHVAQHPEQALGPEIAAEYHNSLPFLLKLLAADQPLSLQAHPSLAQAQEGFARENEAGIALHANNRNYKDDNHKPELLVALTDFHAMAGFRPLAETQQLFAALDCPELTRYTTLLSEDPAEEETSLRGLFTTWISLPTQLRGTLIEHTIACAENVLSNADEDLPEWILRTLRNVVDLQTRYPGDVGVLGALLLNHVQLVPGEAIYLDAGNLHAYIRGLGVEIMANSDNVLRGGLTPKYVDVPELVRVLNFVSLADPVVQPEDGVYPVPIEEFGLQRISVSDADGQLQVAHDGPAIVLVTSGQVQVGPFSLEPTEAVWVDAIDPEITIQGTGDVFIATVGRR